MNTVQTKAYGSVNLDPLSEALFGAVAERVGVSLEKVADTIMGLYGVPSDYFYAAWDHEIATLTDRYQEVAPLKGP